jgi:hypothetical protein
MVNGKEKRMGTAQKGKRKGTNPWERWTLMQKPVVEKRYGGGANAVSAIGIGSDACVSDEVNENESENATETKGGNWNGCGGETVTESDHAYCET